MKIQDIAKELNIDISKFLIFVREQGIRQAKPSTKLDPGTTTKLKKNYKLLQEKKHSEQEVLPNKTISFNKESIKISELTTLLEFPLAQIMKIFLQKGLMVNVNSEIDQETLIEISKDLNITIEIDDLTVENELGLKTKVMEIESESIAESNDISQTAARPPVITIMGHVDHGKTLLLDKIRKSNVIDVESGGITQHIGAYQITHNNNKLTFLDTPGHEAFTTLRARGAQITDIAILVVAADDGVKPQTIEAINHAHVADVPIIVAINKIDKPDIDIDNVKQQLSQYNLLAEDWGGKTITVPLSAKTGKGINDLLEMIELVAELQELKSNPKSACKAIVIESKLSSQKGPIGTIIVKAGTLNIGDFFIIDEHYGKVRAIFNDENTPIKRLFPGDPGEILGFSNVPQPGSILESRKTEKDCKDYIEQQKKTNDKSKKLSQKMSVSLEALSSQAEEGNLRQLNLIIKADVHGSLEAIKGAIEKIESKDIPIKIIHFSTGSITENDVLLAKASKGIIFGFNAEPSQEASRCAQKENVSIKTYSIIYNILDDIQKVIQGLYKIEFEEIEQSEVLIREIFRFSKIGKIAGCHVKKGKIDRNDKIRILRDGKEIFSGEIDSLKRFKEDVKEVAEGFECGIVLKGMDDLEIDDVLISFKIKEKKVI